MSNTSPKIKIVILVNELLRGGAQRIILDIAKNINRTVFSLRIVYLKSHENFESNIKTLAGEIETSGIPVTCLYGGKHFSMGEAWQLYRFLRNEKPDVLHLFLPYAGILGRIIGRYAGVKAIVSTQCNLPLAYSPKIYWLDKLTLFWGLYGLEQRRGLNFYTEDLFLSSLKVYGKKEEDILLLLPALIFLFLMGEFCPQTEMKNARK